jgi:hypothetical protein
MIEWLARQATERAVAAIAAGVASGGVVTPPAPSPATGAVFGDVVGALLGPLTVVALHGRDVSPPTLTATEDDYDPAARENLVWRLDFDSFGLTGIVAPTEVGEVHLLVALSAGTLAHEDAGSTAENRFLIPGATSLSLEVDDLVWVYYDGTSQRWRVVRNGGASDVAYKLELDDVGGGVTYIGEAVPGTATSDPNWRIKKLIETAPDLEIAWADGTAAFTKVWDDRVSLSYS